MALGLLRPYPNLHNLALLLLTVGGRHLPHTPRTCWGLPESPDLTRGLQTSPGSPNLTRVSKPHPHPPAASRGSSPVSVVLL